MFALAALCLVAGILPGFFIDALAPVAQRAGRRAACRVQSGVAWLSIVPIAESRSSYNGLLRLPLHRACRDRSPPSRSTVWPRDRLRRGPAWDCGFPDPSPATQYTAGELRPADPPRVRHVVFRARETVDMPPPGDTAAGAAHGRRSATCIWEALYAPVAGAVGFAADRLNRLQFLTIRQLSQPRLRALLVLLLLVLAIWP